MSVILVPKIQFGPKVKKTTGPGWIDVKNTKGEKRRPYIRCNCGQILACGNHHIHTDGTVTASFFHDPSRMPNGCGWHVYIQLMDWDRSEFLPGKSDLEKLKDFE